MKGATLIWGFFSNKLFYWLFYICKKYASYIREYSVRKYSVHKYSVCKYSGRSNIKFELLIQTFEQNDSISKLFTNTRILEFIIFWSIISIRILQILLFNSYQYMFWSMSLSHQIYFHEFSIHLIIKYPVLFNFHWKLIMFEIWSN